MNQSEFFQLQSQQKSCGLTVKAYCQKHSIPISTYQYWKRKYELSSTTPTKSSRLIPMQIQHSTSVSSQPLMLMVEGIVESPNSRLRRLRAKRTEYEL